MNPKGFKVQLAYIDCWLGTKTPRGMKLTPFAMAPLGHFSFSLIGPTKILFTNNFHRL